MLLAGGADVNATSKFYEAPKKKTERGEEYPASGALTALVYAARQGDLESTKLLIGAGANVNKTTGDGSSPLLVAAINGNYAVGEFLLQNGADPNIASTEGFGPLYVAVGNRNYNRGTLPINTSDKVDVMDFIK